MAPTKTRSNNINNNTNNRDTKSKCANNSTVKKVSNPTDITKRKVDLKLKKTISSRSMPTISKTSFIGNLKAYTYYFKEYLKSAIFRTSQQNNQQVETKKPKRPFRATCRKYINKFCKITENTAHEMFSKFLEQNNWNNSDPKKLELQIIGLIKDIVKRLLDLDKFSRLLRSKDVNLPDLNHATINSKRCCYILLTIYLKLVEKGVVDNITNINQIWCILKPLTMEIVIHTYEILTEKMSAIVRDADAIYNYFLVVAQPEITNLIV